VPLLVYLSVGIDRSDNLTKHDVAAIASSVFMSLFAFLTYLDIPFALGVIFMILSVLSYIGMIVTLLSANKQNTEIALAILDGASGRRDSMLRILNTQVNLATALCLLTPSFVIVYLLAAIKLYDSSVLLLCFLICNVSTKSVYTALAMTAYRRYGSNDLYLSHRYRRNLLRHLYLLNTIEKTLVGPFLSLSAGIDSVQSSSSKYSESESDGLLMAKKAVKVLTESSKDIHNLSDTRNEGLIELQYFPVSLKEFFNSFLIAHQTYSQNRSVSLSVSIHPEVPEIVLCDAMRMYYALSIFLQTTIAHNPLGINILISVAGEQNGLTNPAADGTFMLSLSLMDDGKMKPCQDIERLIYLNQVTCGFSQVRSCDIIAEQEAETKRAQSERKTVNMSDKSSPTNRDRKQGRGNLFVSSSSNSLVAPEISGKNDVHERPDLSYKGEELDHGAAGGRSWMYEYSIRSVEDPPNVDSDVERLPAVGLPELAVVFDIIGLFGGEIRYTSGVGSGSVLRIVLPVTIVDRQESAEEWPGDELRQPSSHRSSKSLAAAMPGLATAKSSQENTLRQFHSPDRIPPWNKLTPSQDTDGSKKGVEEAIDTFHGDVGTYGKNRSGKLLSGSVGKNVQQRWASGSSHPIVMVLNCKCTM